MYDIRRAVVKQFRYALPHICFNNTEKKHSKPRIAYCNERKKNEIKTREYSNDFRTTTDVFRKKPENITSNRRKAEHTELERNYKRPAKK